MQILMGVHNTLITINESRVHTKNMIHFIQSNFVSCIEHNNSILLNYSPNEYHQRVFLLKWLYTLHTNITNNSVPNLKELLVNRVHKPIKIEFKNRKSKRIYVNVEIIDEKNLKLYLNRQDFYLFSDFKSILRKYIDRFETKERHIEISIEDEDFASHLKEIFSNSFKDSSELFFILIDKKKIDALINGKSILNEFQNALLILNSQEGEQITTIRTKYKKLLKKYHPDNVFMQHCEKEYTQKFQLIQNAYSIVKQQLSS